MFRDNGPEGGVGGGECGEDNFRQSLTEKEIPRRYPPLNIPPMDIIPLTVEHLISGQIRG